MPKNHIRPHVVLDAADMTVDQQSAPTNIEYLDNTSYQISWTGAPAGILDVEVSNDYNPVKQNPALPANSVGTWSKLNLLDNLGNPIDTSVVTSPYTIDLNQLASAYVRVSFTSTGAAGDLSVIVTSKSV